MLLLLVAPEVALPLGWLAIRRLLLVLLLLAVAVLLTALRLRLPDLRAVLTRLVLLEVLFACAK